MYAYLYVMTIYTTYYKSYFINYIVLHYGVRARQPHLDQGHREGHEQAVPDGLPAAAFDNMIIFIFIYTPAHIYIYTYIHDICVHIYIYIYIYI